MYRIKSFSNAREFQELFGVQEHGNGVKSRRNRILLAFLKHKPIWEWCHEHDNWELLGIKSMAELKKTLIDTMAYLGVEQGMRYKVELNQTTLRSNIYSTDDFKGVPEDGSSNFVRYVNHSNNNGVFKMRAGRFFGKIISETSLGQALPQQVTTWLCEEFTADWEIYICGTLPQFTLHVDDDFKRIYSSDDCVGDFGSCMEDKGYYSFYEDSVSAKAAYLTDNDGLVIARCVIFTDVYDEEGNKYVLAERQYSVDGKDILKRVLIEQLKKTDKIKIQGYKQIGAGCSDVRAFVGVNGESLCDKMFEIKCNLEWGSALSYQDSFRYYNMSERKAYNHTRANYDYCLDTTCGSLENAECDDDDDEMFYAEYQDRDAYEVVDVFFHGDTITCDADCLEDFVHFNNEYYHLEDLTTCHECEGRMLSPDYYADELHYSSITNRHYCCQSCREKAEQRYKEERERETGQILETVEEEALIAV